MLISNLVWGSPSSLSVANSEVIASSHSCPKIVPFSIWLLSILMLSFLFVVFLHRNFFSNLP